MPTNKNALIRYKVLDQCFRNPARNFFIEDLVDECSRVLREIDPAAGGVKRRQILDDIKFMESSEGWQIDLERHKDSKRVYYRYTDTSFSINNMPLNSLELEQLRSAFLTLSRFKGMPQFEWVGEILPRLEVGMSKSDEEPFIEFDHNPYLTGSEYLEIIYTSILYKKTLQIDYQPFDKELADKQTIHPYFLKQYNSRWFLLGMNEAFPESLTILALDRMKSVKETNQPYIPNETIDWSEYFEDMVGVSRPDGAEPEHILLHFFGKHGHYIETKPIHSSQRAKWIQPDVLEVRLNVIINKELERVILRSGDEVKVIAPESLKNLIKERLVKALSNY
jgi:predicted DNA-binding transcriptional regulator YafY